MSLPKYNWMSVLPNLPVPFYQNNIKCGHVNRYTAHSMVASGKAFWIDGELHVFVVPHVSFSQTKLDDIIDIIRRY